MYKFSQGVWPHGGGSSLLVWLAVFYAHDCHPAGRREPLDSFALPIIARLLADIQRLGSPRWLVAPNKIHHLYLAEWQDAFPDAKLFAAPGLSEKRSDLDFDAQLGHEPDKAWAGEIDQLIFRGSYAMQEVVFFHRASSTVIVTDLIENFSPDHFKGVGKVLAKLAGIISPYGKTPLDWRLTFVFGKKEAKRSVQQILRWRPRHLVLAHGECIEDDAAEFIRKSFSWV